jgi:hypothetical protein
MSALCEVAQASRLLPVAAWEQSDNVAAAATLSPGGLKRGYFPVHVRELNPNHD